MFYLSGKIHLGVRHILQKGLDGRAEKLRN
jgi:hypothetical protein